MRILVTRVQPQAQAWVELLQEQNHDALALPLIEVQGLADLSGIQAAGQGWPTYAAVMFVSRHAVDFFFKENKALAHDLYAQAAIKTRAWSTGPGTAQALLAHGLPEAYVESPSEQAGQFDSEALWQRVQTQVRPGDKVLIVRGRSLAEDGVTVADNDAGVGRDWLAQRLTDAGVQVDFVVAYQRGAPVWNAQQCAMAQAAAADGTVWLFSSAEALGHLNGLLPGQDWSQARAVATHPRIAEAVRKLGFGRVLQARPVLADVLASIESMA
ncbi:MAG: uroporphyrinogen-III synthase [Comamonadaceae bacterium]|nr:MAG: uroporphyrinogen-III synthase [Comamonadaceae bacterium]